MNGANGVNSVGGLLSKIAAEREAQRSYWTEHSVETTVEAMMLDSQAKAIDLEERPEVSCSTLQHDPDRGRPVLLELVRRHRLLSPHGLSSPKDA